MQANGNRGIVGKILVGFEETRQGLYINIRENKVLYTCTTGTLQHLPTIFVKLRLKDMSMRINHRSRIAIF